MARKRARYSYCPSCDARLDAALAKETDPRCPECEEPLLPVQSAPIWRRAAAAAVDTAILLPTAGLLNWLLLLIVNPEPLVGDSEGIDALLRLLELDPAAILRRVAPFFAMSGIYLGLFWTLKGRTIGGRLLRLKVVDWRGRPPTPALAVVRVATHFVGLAAGALGWIWAAFDAEKRAWHDHLSRTYVVRDT
jgi:uncharacterized RDD family membrane protein YckC